ncbi:MAG: type I DNA topoisomerase [Candidatus Parcubacteria bacterium]|nr:type I DNA topoisomerase [Candidatus Parcubacteria bacterium]
MPKSLVIVESPTKAKTITKFLGKDFKVESSFGHIRDLPQKKLGVDVKNNFEPTYEIPIKAQKQVDKLKKLAASAQTIILATDEDREGEAIAWHLLNALNLEGKHTERIAFHEITKKAIEEALKNPRELDMHLVDAQQARRILDRLVGYKLSPLLWKKVARGLSAGRVQSVAVRLIVDREREIQKFNQEEYWSIEAELQKSEQNFLTQLAQIKGKAIDKMAIKNETEAQNILAELNGAKYQVSKIEKKEAFRQPPTPFTTSTLQQEAGKKLGYSAKQTMMLAQQLYEGIELGTEGSVGLITYMRTDSLNLSDFSLTNIRDYIQGELGDKYLPAKAIIYKTKSKGAQEAHEAIRPTDVNHTPDSIAGYLEPKQLRLYKLIWQRTLACQMMPAIIDQTKVDIQANDYTFRANGSTIKFDGFLKIYRTGIKENILPDLKEGDLPKLIDLKKLQHFTQPPARYSEATLIKAMEEYGIGRPSTYAPTISTVQDRNYVKKNDEKKLYPTEIGILVNDLLVAHFPQIVDLNFTAKMEEDLDKIAEGKMKWQPVIKEFYEPFAANLIIKEKEIDKKELTEEKTDLKCDKCGSPMIVKMGRFGKFLACSNYPECKNIQPMMMTEEEHKALETNETCPKCNAPLIIKTGRFGKFLACSKYPDCKFTKPIQKSIGLKCPKCSQGDVVVKKSKRGKIFYACNRYPDCDYASWEKPVSAEAEPKIEEET